MARLDQYQLIDTRPRTALQRIVQQIRAVWATPKSISTHDGWTTATTATGQPISEQTALAYSAVWAAVNLIASDVSGLPLQLFKRLAGGGKDRMIGHPLYRLLHDRPNPELTSVVFRKALQAHALTWGNGYAEIERDQADRPRALWLLTPDRVTPFRSSPSSALQYRVTNGGRGDVIIDAHDMIHVAGLGWDGTQGYSVIAKARESIGLGVASERFGGTFFGNGATFGGVISYKGPRPPEMSEKNYRDQFKKQYGGVENAHSILALYNDAHYERLGIPPDDAQFLETRQFQVTEVARWFNIPPHKIGDLSHATFSNIEQQSIDYLTQTLLPWLKAWEQELAVKLIAGVEQSQQLIEHNVDGFLRADSQARGEHEAKQFQIGAVTPNEIRAIENRNPIAGGDRSFVPLNLIPLDRLDEWLDAEIEAKKTPKAAPAPDPAAAAALQRAVDDLTAERDRARDQAHAADQARQALQADLGTVQGRLQAADQAIQQVLIDAIARLVQKETDRARRAQQSPDKLRAFVDTFYPVHRVTCRTVLQPLIKALLVGRGDLAAVDATLDAWIDRSIAQSRGALLALAADCDADTLAPALESLLRLWDNSRAELSWSAFWTERIAA